MRVPLVLATIVLSGVAPSAQQATPSGPAAPAWPTAIEDNSFLIEEAYNQEPGVVQFIASALRLSPGGQWQTGFTNEWPVPGMRHQLSYVVSYSRGTRAQPGGAGDLQLNYRYQALDEDRSGVAFAPRFSLLLPTSGHPDGLALDVVAYQVGLPFSKRVARQLAAHVNVGATVWPGVSLRQQGGGPLSKTLTAWTQGASVIWLASPTFNVFVEGVAQQVQSPAVGAPQWDRQLVLNPGARAAVNTSAGQLVIGGSVPIGVTASSPDASVMLYASWEMRIWGPRGSPP